MAITCESCKYAILQDYGYYNWAVEGTEFECGIGKHPDGRFDRFYGEEPKLEYAAECDRYALGEPIVMDIDMVNFSELEEWQQMLYSEGKIPFEIAMQELVDGN